MSGEGSPPFKRKRTRTSEAEGMGDKQLLQSETLYGQPNRSKAGFVVIRDSTTSSEFSEFLLAISASSSIGESESRIRNRTIREKHLFELEGYVDKYQTRFSSAIELDK